MGNTLEVAVQRVSIMTYKIYNIRVVPFLIYIKLDIHFKLSAKLAFLNKLPIHMHARFG